jgi:hypothetical protein
MAGITIEPSLAGFSSAPQQTESQQTGIGGVVIDPSLMAPIQETTQPVTRSQGPSGFMQGLSDPVYGISQIIAKGLEMLPESARLGNRPIAASARAFSENVIPQRESNYQLQREAAGETGFDYGRMGGNVASGLLPGMAITKGAGLIAPASRTAQSLIGGGVSSGLLTPVESSTDFAANKAQQVLLGAGLGYGVDKTIGAVISPAMTAAAQKMKDLGVSLTPGQAFGGMTQTIEDLLAKLPVVGATARQAQGRALQDFNTGVINDALSDVGKTLPKGVTGREAVKYMNTEISKSYDDVLPKINVAPTLDIYQKIGSTLQSAQDELTPEFNKRLNDYVERNIINPLANRNLTGIEFKRIDSQLGKFISTYGIKGGDDGLYADALKNVQMALRDNVKAINPDDSKLVEAANAAWAKKLRIEGAAGYLSGEAGQFTPAQLQAASKALNATARKGGFSRGDAVMQDVAEQGITSLGSGPVKSTQLGGGLEFGAGGAGIGAALAGGSLPLTAALPLIPMAGYSRIPQAAFNALMTSGRPSIAPAIRQQVPAAMSPGITGELGRDQNIPRIELRGMAR